MRRPQCYNQLYNLGAGLKRERPDSMQEWQVASVTSPSIAQGNEDETSLHRCARGKRAMRRPHATINFIFWELTSEESARTQLWQGREGSSPHQPHKARTTNDNQDATIATITVEDPFGEKCRASDERRTSTPKKKDKKRRDD
jgi:hypothetical protein